MSYTASNFVYLEFIATHITQHSKLDSYGQISVFHELNERMQILISFFLVLFVQQELRQEQVGKMVQNDTIFFFTGKNDYLISKLNCLIPIIWYLNLIHFLLKSDLIEELPWEHSQAIQMCLWVTAKSSKAGKMTITGATIRQSIETLILAAC